MTWQEIVIEVLNRLPENRGELKEIYNIVQNNYREKCKDNSNWKAKVRQTLQILRDKEVVVQYKKGEWGLR
jgi:hypothetical protein